MTKREPAKFIWGAVLSIQRITPWIAFPVVVLVGPLL